MALAQCKLGKNTGVQGQGRREEGSLEAGCPLHGLKLINALLGIALPDLAQGLVFVSAQSHVLSMDHVIGSLLGLITGIGQLRSEGL